MMARARGSLPVVVEAVDTSWAAKAERGQGWGEASCPGLEGLRKGDGPCLRAEAGPVLRVWERKQQSYPRLKETRPCLRNLRRGRDL